MAGPWHAPGIGTIAFVSQRHIDAAADHGGNCQVTLKQSVLSSTNNQQWVIAWVGPCGDDMPSSAPA